jgi:hypothetical protein
MLLQKPRDCVDFLLQLAVSRHRVIKDDRGLVGIALCRHFEIVIQARYRNMELLRLPFWPEAVMGLRHFFVSSEIPFRPVA